MAQDTLCTWGPLCYVIYSPFWHSYSFMAFRRLYCYYWFSSLPLTCKHPDAKTLYCWVNRQQLYGNWHTGSRKRLRKEEGNEIKERGKYERLGGKAKGKNLRVWYKNITKEPWLVWLSGPSTGLQTKRLPVWFPVRAHTWVLGQVPSRGCSRGNHTLMFPSLLPFLLSKNKK